MSAISIRVIDNSQVFMRLKDEYTSQILSDIGETAVVYAQENVPVDTGALRSSIDYDVDYKAVRVYAHEPYAAYVEMGTRYMRAQPFLQPAVLDHADEWKSMAESIYKDNGNPYKKSRVVYLGE